MSSVTTEVASEEPGRGHSLRESIDQDSAVARALLHLAIVLAEMECDLARERNLARLKQVKTTGGLMEMQRDVLGDLSEKLGVPIQGFFKEPRGDRSTFWVKIDGGLFRLGGINNLISPKKFMERFADTTGHLIPEWSRAEWHPIAQDMLDACEEMAVEEPAQDGSGQISQWSEEYLSENPSTDDSSEAAVTYQPLRKGEEIYIHLKNFQQWIEPKYGQKLNSKELGGRLRACGAEPVKIDIMVGGVRGSRNFWKLVRTWPTVTP